GAAPASARAVAAACPCDRAVRDRRTALGSPLARRPQPPAAARASSSRAFPSRSARRTESSPWGTAGASSCGCERTRGSRSGRSARRSRRSEEHTSELQSRGHLVCRLLLEKKKKKQ